MVSVRLLVLLGASASAATAAPTPPASAAAAAAPSSKWPFAYNWSKFPTAWFGANASHWESDAQVGKGDTCTVIFVCPL